MGVRAIPMLADTGPIGGELSHEFIVLAPTGESQVFYDATLEQMDYLKSTYRYESPADLAAFHELINSYYAATEEKHDTDRWAQVEPAQKREGRGIEVGQIFYFGRKYSDSMKLSVAGPGGTQIAPEMGSYGIGVSRLVGAIIEASHDQAGIIWPDSIAPFPVAILNLRVGDAATDAICGTLYAHFKGQALYDDRDERAGAKFADADLMGHPWQLIVGPRGAAAGTVELKRRATGERVELSVEAALARISEGK
jgi:prolyl-tRNA synthetase